MKNMKRKIDKKKYKQGQNFYRVGTGDSFQLRAFSSQKINYEWSEHNSSVNPL